MLGSYKIRKSVTIQILGGNQVPEARDLLSTYDMPGGWTDRLSLSHDMTVEWNCLEGRRKQDVRTNPEF